MLKNKLEQILLLLVVLAEEVVVVVAVVVVEYHHTLNHVPIEQQAVVKVSDDTYTHYAPLSCCSLYKCTCCMLDMYIYPCLVFSCTILQIKKMKC
jgi:hypothetical protein